MVVRSSPASVRLGVVALAVLLPAAALTPAEAAPPPSSRAAPGVLTSRDGIAPGAPGGAARWTNGAKVGFGTSHTTDSKVWYTVSRGKATEMFYPRIDTPSVRDSLLVVSDGSTFTDREDRDTRHRTRVQRGRGLTFQVVNTARSGDYRITKTFVTDPARDTLLVDVTFRSLTGEPYDVYVLHDPALGNDGSDDTARGSESAMLSSQADMGSAVVADPALTDVSSGYFGVSDGWTDLKRDHRLDWSYTAPEQGNVVQVARTALTGLRGAQRMSLAVGFGPTAGAGESTARETLASAFGEVADSYAAGWRRYLRHLKPMAGSARDWRRQYRVSQLVLAASEDKTVRGGFVAAPARPWAWAFELRDLPVYHAVWSRDQYQIATGLLASGDRAAASRALSFLWRVQQQPDGSFPQNSRLDGEPIFGELQMDEVAFPIVLAWQLGRTGPADWRRVRRSADFLLREGPESPQERWENLGNYSPATIAAEITGLVCAARIAKLNGADQDARRYLSTADRWQQRVEGWTATTNGPLADDPYYLRVTTDGHPDTGTQIQVPDGGPLVDQRRIVDPSFLELVRLGVKRADDPAIRSSVRVVDRLLRFSTPNGPFWHRSSFDGYGETRAGRRWEPTDDGSRTTLGRGWPLLTGERGEYNLAAGLDAQGNLDTMARAANGGTGFMSEQVWDHRPPTPDKGRFKLGEGTLSARPLTWTHAQFLRLARSVDAGHPVETPQIVACRYDSELCRR